MSAVNSCGDSPSDDPFDNVGNLKPVVKLPAHMLVNIKDTTGDIGIGFPGARLPPFITAAAISGLIIFTDIFFTAYYALSGIFEAFAVNLMAANQTSLELEKISHKQGLPVDYGSLTLAEMTVVLYAVRCHHFHCAIEYARNAVKEFFKDDGVVAGAVSFGQDYTANLLYKYPFHTLSDNIPMITLSGTSFIAIADQSGGAGVQGRQGARGQVGRAGGHGAAGAGDDEDPESGGVRAERVWTARNITAVGTIYLVILTAGVLVVAAIHLAYAVKSHKDTAKVLSTGEHVVTGVMGW